MTFVFCLEFLTNLDRNSVDAYVYTIKIVLNFVQKDSFESRLLRNRDPKSWHSSFVQSSITFSSFEEYQKESHPKVNTSLGEKGK